jgi:hypothetical protein
MSCINAEISLSGRAKNVLRSRQKLNVACKSMRRFATPVEKGPP